MEFYVLPLKKKVNIADKDVTYFEKSGRKFAKGIYHVGKKQYTACRIIGGCKPTKKK